MKGEQVGSEGYDRAIPRDDFTAAIGHKLRNIRAAKDKNQDEVAAWIGVTRSAYSHFERGVNLIPLDYLIKLPALFDCGLLDLLPGAWVPERDKAGQPTDSRLREINARWEELPEFLKDGITGMIQRYYMTTSDT
jgi:transcriptional regulator with XRE-family HTH domain